MTVTARFKPLALVARFTLDLYCRYRGPDGQGHSGAHATFYGRTFSQCVLSARAAGWVIHHDRTATCPSCRRRFVHPCAVQVSPEDQTV